MATRQYILALHSPEKKADITKHSTANFVDGVKPATNRKAPGTTMPVICINLRTRVRDSPLPHNRSQMSWDELGCQQGVASRSAPVDEEVCEKPGADGAYKHREEWRNREKARLVHRKAEGRRQIGRQLCEQ